MNPMKNTVQRATGLIKDQLKLPVPEALEPVQEEEDRPLFKRKLTPCHQEAPQKV